MNALSAITPKQRHYYCHLCHNSWLSDIPRGDGPCAHCGEEAVREIICHLDKAAMGNPVRDFDYCAWFDGDEGSGQCGRGATRDAAVNDLLAEYGDMT